MDKLEHIVLGLVAIGVVIIYLVLYSISPESALTAFDFSVQNLIEVSIIFVFAAFLAALIDVYVDKELILKVFNPNRNHVYNYLFATIIGIATPGPVYSIFPIVLMLREKGADDDILISYLTGQTLMGPMRTPLELWFLGLEFFVYRTIITVLIGVLAGIMTRMVINWIGESK